MLRPDIAARNANFIGSATDERGRDAARGSRPCATTRASTRAQNCREKLQPLRARSQAQSREENRIWARFKTGQ